MGTGASAQVVQEHLGKQELLISQLEASLLQQKSGGRGLARPFVYEEGEEEESSSDFGCDMQDEVDAVKAAVSEAMQANTVGLDDDCGDEEVKDIEWKEPSPEEEAAFELSHPWLGAMAPPTGWEYNKPSRDERPQLKVELEHVFGLNTRLCHNNVHWVDDHTILYCASTVGVVHDLNSNKQLIFRGHTTTILALDYNSDAKIVASGQIGKNPYMCVWDSTSGQELARLGGYHKRGVVAVALSPSGELLASLGLSDMNGMAIYQWKTGQLVASADCSKHRLFSVRFLSSETQLATVGKTHIEFWKLNDSQLTGERASLGKNAKLRTFTEVACKGDLVVAGTASGQLYCFNMSGRLMDIVYAHTARVTSLLFTKDDHLLSAGRDGCLLMWSPAMRRVMNINLSRGGALAGPCEITSLSLLGQDVLVTLNNSTVLQVDLLKKEKGDVLLTSHFGNFAARHCYGELWAIAADPRGTRFATVCDDATLRLFDIQARKCVEQKNIGTIAVGGPARTLCWSPDGKWIAAGFLQGSCAIYNASDLTEELRFKKRRRRVQAVRFSPCSKYLAIGTADLLVDVYDAESSFKLVCSCKGNTSVMLSIDWSEDSKYIQTSSQTYELMVFEIPSGQKQAKPRDFRDVKWSTMTSLLGWDVQGIWGPSSDGSEINAVCRSENGAFLATGDEMGQLKIFKYPCVGSGLDNKGKLLRRPKAVVQKGHFHVSNAVWAQGDTHLLTTGGADLCVFQWKIA